MGCKSRQKSQRHPLSVLGGPQKSQAKWPHYVSRGHSSDPCRFHGCQNSLCEALCALYSWFCGLCSPGVHNLSGSYSPSYPSSMGYLLSNVWMCLYICSHQLLEEMSVMMIGLGTNPSLWAIQLLVLGHSVSVGHGLPLMASCYTSHWLATSTCSVPPLPLHILQVLKVWVNRFCGCFAVPATALEIFPDYWRLFI